MEILRPKLIGVTQKNIYKLHIQLCAKKPDFFVIGSGKTYSWIFCQEMFWICCLNYKKYVVIDKNFLDQVILLRLKQILKKLKK